MTRNRASSAQPTVRPPRYAARCGARSKSFTETGFGSVPTDSLTAVTEKVSVVLPCLNEIASVADVVKEAKDALCKSGMDGEVIVVDNGSTDGSPEAAIRAGARVVMERRRGYGAAYMGGFAAATGDVILMADADGSDDFSEFPTVLQRLREAPGVLSGA